MSRRIERLNHVIREELSQLLQRQVKDPRLGGLVTVTRVSTSPDLRHAKIFISMLGNEEEKREVLVALAVASGFLRKELSTRLRLRQSPQLSFYYDDSMEQAAEVLQLISQVSSETGGSAGGR